MFFFSVTVYKEAVHPFRENYGRKSLQGTVYFYFIKSTALKV